MNNNEHRELLEKALHEIKRLRQERESPNTLKGEPIAVLGMACRFPGSVTPEQVWELSREGIDCITKVPANRWDAEKYYHPDPDIPGKTVTKEGGFLADIRGFDPAFFGISPREARSMDPQQRLLLEVTWEAIERAAIAADSLYNTAVGVFLGLSNLEYATLIRQSGDIGLIDSYFGTGNAASVAAGRIAYVFGFHGPTFTIDTACSSSLVAVHLAAASLRRRECNMAVAGGVNLMISPETSVHFSNARMLASDGRCKSFSAQANGYGRAEGCGVVLLKRLSDAIRDRDPIEAVIVGSAINHDGRSAGLTAPNGPSQEAVIRSALTEARLEPGDIQFIETHGTGTPLGDPIEAGAIARVYGHGRTEANPVYLSSIKANIGHAEAAAGIAGFIHACECLKHRQIPPLLHMLERSPHIGWKSLAFAKTRIDLPGQAMPIRAAISSFGFSGTNAHFILQEYREQPFAGNLPVDSPIPVPLREQIFVLSAKTQDALVAQATKFVEWFETNPDVCWQDICYSLQVGRTHFASRFAFTASGIPEAVACLRLFVGGESLKDCNTNELTMAFTSGKNLDWTQNVTDKTARRICLPTYAFQREDFWVPESKRDDLAMSPSAPHVKLAEDAWTLSEAEFLQIRDHQLFGAAIMPAVGWLELASRTAKKHVGPSFQLQKIAFSKMFVLGSGDRPTMEVCLSGTSLSNCSLEVGVRKDSKTDTGPLEAYVTGQVILDGQQVWLGGNLETHRQRFIHEMSSQSIYEQLESVGLAYGPAFRKLTKIWYDSKEALGQLDVTNEDGSSLDGTMVRLGHLDSSLQVVAGAAKTGDFSAQDGTAFVPVSIRSAQWFDIDALPAWSLAVVSSSETEYAMEADVFVWSHLGRPMLQLLGMKFEGFATAKKTNSSPNKQSLDRAETALPTQSTTMGTTRILAMPPSLRFEALEKHLRTQLAAELEISEEKLLTDQPLAELGLDSLMVFKLGIKMESEFGFAMDSRALMQGLSLRELTNSLLWKVESLASKESEQAVES